MSRVVWERVAKVYPGGVQAIRDVSLEIGDGEFLVLLGPSGCGKSTMLRMVAGLEAVSSGRIWIGDRVVNDVGPRDRDVAMVFQNDALYPHLTVYKNMAFGLRLRKVPKADINRKVRETAEWLGLSELLDRKPASLSGGQRRRVAIGRAVVRNPQVFLFDEPLSNLDAGLRVAMRTEFKKLHRRLRTTTVYVTHDQEEAVLLGDRVAVVKDGTLQQCASPEEVYHQPANRFVAGFVGVPAMNFLDGTLNGSTVGEADGLYFDADGRPDSCRVRVPERFQDRLAGLKGRRLILGVRPEHLSDHGEGRADGQDGLLRVTVKMIEPLGEKKNVFGRTSSGLQLVWRVGGQREIREGQSVLLGPDPERIHFFEPGDTGVNVSVNGIGASSSAN